MSKVLFTDRMDIEVSHARELSSDRARKYYVYGKDFEGMDSIKSALSDFCFIPLKDTMSAKYSTMFSENNPSDFFVLKYPRLGDIMDRDIEMHQTVLKGTKLVVDDHPFIGKKDVYWCYFLWSFVDKTLLGYPHCYTFRGAKPVSGIDPFDCRMLAAKVACATATTIRRIFHDDILVTRVSMDDSLKRAYEEEKRKLFEVETSHWMIIRKLKKFVNDQVPDLKKGLSLLNINRVHDQYKKGERTLVVSDAGVDTFLEAEFWNHVRDVNTFMGALWNGCSIK